MSIKITLEADRLFHLRYFSSREKIPVYLYWESLKNLDKIQPQDYHAAIEAQYIRQGEGTYIIDGRPYPVCSGSLLLIQPNEVHSFVPGLAPVDKCVLYFSPGFMKNVLEEIQCGPKFPHHMRPSEKEAVTIDFLLHRIEAEQLAKGACWEQLVTECLKEFLFLVKRISLKPEVTRNANPIVEQMLLYVERHFLQPMLVSKIAKTFGFSPNYLSALFKKHAGMGLKRYILTRRILEARKLLENDRSLKLVSVAETCGFENYADFNRHFKHILKMTPAGYRRFSQSNR
jgi:AraC-like DNA-binding protein